MFVVLSWMMWICFLPIALAKDIVIQPSGTNDALYEALKAATSGDKIILEAGMYKECVNSLGKDLILEGRAGAKVIGNGSCSYTIQVDGGQLDINSLGFSHDRNGCIAVNGRQSLVRLNDVSISDCGAASLNGGGVTVIDGTLEVKNSRFFKNKGSKGAGIYAKDAAVRVENSIFSDNIALIGGGIYLQGSEGTVTSTRFVGNKTRTGGFGGAIAVRETSFFTLQQSSLQNNHAQGKGGGIYVDNGQGAKANRLSIDDVQFVGNSASLGSSAGGALYVRNNIQLVVQNSRFEDNVATVNGGAVFLYDIFNEVNILDSMFDNNRARGGAGGAIVVAASSEQKAGTLSVKRSQFKENRAGGYGGAISSGNTYNLLGSLHVSDCTFEKNFADSSRNGAGGAIYYASAEPFSLRIEKSTFSANRAELTGGAVYAYQPQFFWIEESTFVHNEAVGPSTVLPRFGGGVMVDGAKVFSVERSNFCHNVVSSSGSERISGSGGGIYVQKVDRVDLQFNRIWENRAQQFGGGVALDSVTQPALINNTIVGNSAGEGGALWVKDSSSSLVNTIIAYTQAGVAATGSSDYWHHNNWYNNSAGNSKDDTLPNTSVGDTELHPHFQKIIIDGRCEDQLILPSSSQLRSAGDETVEPSALIGAP